MTLVKTKSFEMATYANGDPSSSLFALVLPGRLDTKDYSHMHGHVDYLADRGIFALSFDPPGTWESPGVIELYTMTNYLKAIHELIEYFGNKPTLLIGHSRGGSMAMLAGMKNTFVTHIIAVMSSTAPSAISEGTVRSGFETSYRDMPSNNRELKKRFDLPLSYFQDANQYDLLQDLRHCVKPKLFFLGTQDTIVDPQEVREAYAAAGEPKRLCELNAVHDYRRDRDSIDQVNQDVGKFLDDFGFLN